MSKPKLFVSRKTSVLAKPKVSQPEYSEKQKQKTEFFLDWYANEYQNLDHSIGTLLDFSTGKRLK